MFDENSTHYVYVDKYRIIWNGVMEISLIGVLEGEGGNTGIIFQKLDDGEWYL